jgi:eukaryotic-like serine/threonine-protein kinase
VSISYWKTDWFISMVVVLFFLLTAGTDPMRNLEWQTYDLGVRFSSSDPANSDVVVVAIDDLALQELGAWPWPRDILAQATQRISAQRPSVIGFALPFDSDQTALGQEYLQELKAIIEANPKYYNNKIQRLLREAEIRMGTDQIFARSLSQAGRVVLAMPYLIDKKHSQLGQAQLSEYLEKYTLRDVEGIPDPDNLLDRLIGANVPEADVVYPPIEPLTQYAGGAGFLNLGYGGDRYVRTEPMVLRYGDNYLPSFALMMAARNRFLATRSIQVTLGDAVTLDNYVIPTDRELRIYPHFYRGRKDQPAFRTYSILDVINRKVESSAFRDKTVLVGLTARQHVNPMITPIGEVMTPVMVAANTVSSLLNNELYKVPTWATLARLLALAGIALYLMLFLPRLRLGTGLAITALLSIGLLNVQFYFMISESTWIKLMMPLMALLVGHLVMSGKHYLEHSLRHIHQELSAANRALGQSFQAQGQLDQAFEMYRKTEVDESVLNHLYNLGLDYERKRQFNKAVAVFKYIAEQKPDYSDVLERIKRTQQVSDALLGGGSTAAGGAANGTLVISTTGVQKPMLGRYEIDKELGRGAMGMVYLGHDPKIGRTVAIKTMSLAQEFEGDKLADVKARFFREAETAGRLNHPNIVTIYDVGEDQDLSYIAMDYLKGDNLLAWCKADNLLPAVEVVDLMIQVADGLDYAGTQKVVHRDIKPANIIYDQESGTLKVTDFGVACLTDTSKTKTGTILGSPSYMSPEQLAGNKVDGRSDLFSLGVTMYQLLCGELPFIADSLASLMYKIANEKHPDIRMFRPELPACISQIINKALQKEAADRFQTGSQMAKALMRCRTRIESKKNKTRSRASA